MPYGHNAYHDALSQASETLESLGHDLGFEHMLNDHVTERTAYAQFEPETYLQMNREAMPEAMSARQYLPGDFTIGTFRAQLSELPMSSEMDEENSWSLTAAYELDGVETTLITTPAQTTVTSTNINGEPLTYVCPTDTGARFLLNILGTALERDIEDLAGNLPGDAFTSPRVISNTLGLIGRLMGTSRKTTVSNLQHPDAPDRTLIVALQETETPNTSGMNVDYYLACELVPEKLTAMVSSQNEVMTGQTIQHRYGKRHPTDIPADQLYLAVQMGLFDHPDEVFLNPYTQREQYDLVSAAVMTVVEHHMKPYSRYKRTDRSDIPNELDDIDMDTDLL